MVENLGRDMKLESADWLDGVGKIAFTEKKDIAAIENAENVRQALIVRLNCPKGSILWHPEYGNGIFDILSDVMDDNFFVLALSEIRDCITAEPRAGLVDIRYEVSHAERMVVYTVYYRVLGQPKVYNLVYAYKEGGW